MPNEQNSNNNIQLAYESVNNLVKQGQQIWKEYETMVFASKYYQIENIVICGMGGSSLPAHILKEVYSTKVPLQIVQGYTLPSWANEKTLVILSSYSGETEETLSCAVHAEENRCVITGITSGGSLEKFFTVGNYPFCKINTDLNPSNAPRYGLGYGIFGILRILSKLELLDKCNYASLEKDINETIENIQTNIEKIKENAQRVTEEFKDKIVVTMVSEHLGGVGRTASNLLNETSKSMAFYKHIPEANHNLIQGFTEFKEDLIILFLRSEKYTARLQRRMDLTKKILEQNGYKTHLYQMETPVLVNNPSLFEETLNNIIFTANLSVSLAEQKNVDPVEIPIIDNIKKELLGSY